MACLARLARPAGAGRLDVRLLRRTSRATPRKARTRGLDAPRRQASALLDGGISTIGTQTTLGWAKQAHFARYERNALLNRIEVRVENDYVHALFTQMTQRFSSASNFT